MKNIPAKLLVAVAFVAATGALARGCTSSLADATVYWSPEKKAQAARIIAQTELETAQVRRWQTIVMPELQAAEAAVAQDAIAQRHLRRMRFETATHYVALTALSVAGAATVTLAVAVCAFLAFATIRNARRTVQLQPARTLPGRGKPVQFPGLVYTPRTGAAHSIIAAHDADGKHGRLLNAGDTEKINAIASAIFMPRNHVESRVLTLSGGGE